MYYHNSNKNTKVILEEFRQPEFWVHMEKINKQRKFWIKE